MDFADGVLVFTYRGPIVNVITTLFMIFLLQGLLEETVFRALASQYLQLPDEETEGSCDLMSGATQT